MARYSTGFVQCVAPGGLTLSVMIFLTPSWENKPVLLNKTILGVVLSMGFCAFPLSVLRGIWTCRCTNNLGYIGDDEDLWKPQEDYYKAQYQWPKELKYHKDHFMYKILPEKVNPEFLTENVSATVKADALKQNYARATRDAAERVDEDRDSVACLDREGYDTP